MSGTSYVQRRIDLTFAKANGSFTDGGTNSATVSGLRVNVAVTRAGAPSFNQMQARIYGLTPSMMNDLSTLGMVVTTAKRNTVSIYAGDANSGIGLVFSGTVYDAWANFESMPEVSFDIKGQTGLTEAITPVSPVSYQNGADVVTVIQAIAGQMGRTFENNGVSGIHLANPYFPGTATQQLQEAADAAGINWHDDGPGHAIAIWPAGGSRNGEVPLISPQTGMVGYPRYTENGIDVVTIYNPDIQLGGKVQVQSSLPQATGTWTVYGMVHNLVSITPGGDWFTAMRLIAPGYYGRLS